MYIAMTASDENDMYISMTASDDNDMYIARMRSGTCF